MTPYGDRCAKCDLDLCDPGALSCGDSPTSPRMAAAAIDLELGFWDPSVATLISHVRVPPVRLNGRSAERH